MADERKYSRFVITEPKVSFDYKFHPVGDTPFRFYMSSDLVPEATVFSDVFWRTEIPDPNPTCDMHSHPVPQLLMFAGEEGSFEVEVPLEDELYILTRTTVIWIPPHTMHSVKYNRIDKPMMETGILIGSGEYK